MKKYLLIALAIMAAIAACEAADDTDFDPAYEGSTITFTAASNVSGVAPMSFTWGENISSKAVQSGTQTSGNCQLTLRASKNNNTDSPYIRILISGGQTNAWLNTWNGQTISVGIPDGNDIAEFSGTAAVIITQRGSIMGEKTVGTFTATASMGNETLTISGSINLKYQE